MKEIPLTSAQADILAEFDSAGGVVDYVVISAGRASDSAERIHRAAAIFGLQVLDVRTTAWSRRHRIVLTPPGPIGRAITVQQFENGEGQADFITHGYQQAFLSPPYSLHPRSGSGEELYAEANRQMFGDLSSITEIFSWSTDWSNYFEAGHEWWGAFLWTLRLPNGHIIWVGASSTD